MNEAGTTLPQILFLARLRQAGGGTASDLADTLNMSLPAVSQMVDRLFRARPAQPCRGCRGSPPQASRHHRQGQLPSRPPDPGAGRRIQPRRGAPLAGAAQGAGGRCCRRPCANSPRRIVPRDSAAESAQENMMNEKHIGRSVRRLEDSRFLIGRGRYVADIAAAAALHGHVLRSPHAHALIERIDVSRGASLAGVQGIYTAADLAADGLGPLPCMAAVKPLIVPPRPALAAGPRAPCRRSGGLHRGRQRGDRARSGRAGRGRLPAAARRRRRQGGARRRRTRDLGGGAGQSRLPSPQGRRRGRGAGDEAGGARRRDRGDEQPRRRGAHRAARRHRPLRRGDADDGTRIDRAGAARHPPPARRVRLQAAARAHPAPRARCRRRLRHEELPLSRMGAAAVGGAQARPAGALARRADGGVRDRSPRPRHRGHGASWRSTRRAASWRSTWRWWPISAPIFRPTAPAPRPSPHRRRRAASTTFPPYRSTCAAPSPIRCRSMPIAAPASPRPTISSSAPSKPRRARSAAIRPSSGGRT